MDRRTRICIWIILLGLANFMAFWVIYLAIGGEAISGEPRYDASGHLAFHLKGPRQEDVLVSKGIYIYSGIHSISIWPTVAAVFLAMLTLAKDLIVSSMRSTIVRGRTFITILATIITFATAVFTIWSILLFTVRLNPPRGAGEPPAPTSATRP